MKKKQCKSCGSKNELILKNKERLCPTCYVLFYEPQEQTDYNPQVYRVYDHHRNPVQADILDRIAEED